MTAVSANRTIPELEWRTKMINGERLKEKRYFPIYLCVLRKMKQRGALIFIFFFLPYLFLMQHSAQKFPHAILILYQFTNMVLPTSIKHPSAEFLISSELCNNVPFSQPCKISHCGRPQEDGAAWFWLSLLPDEINDNSFFKSLRCCLVYIHVSSETEKECEWGLVFFFFFSPSQ